MALPADIEHRIAAPMHRVQAACAQAGVVLDADAQAKLERVAVISDFALDVFARRPESLRKLLEDDGASRFTLAPASQDDAAGFGTSLRRYRQDESTRLIWRDAQGLDSTEIILRESTRLAEDCMAAALAFVQTGMEARHGEVRDTDGNRVQLVVFGLGKLGGNELNFSSDIDIVFAYENEGESDGARPLAAEQYFARMGQQFAKLLDEVTAEGFSHRVDLRLRPYGNAGRMAWSFAALEHYFQREGRDWERYAWLKARAVAGDIAAGARFAKQLKPFVYRRYLDYGAIDGLREMKASINAEVARKDMAGDVKRGPGGIREVEFFAQVLQLIRGGRETRLQRRGFMTALAALKAAGLVPAEDADAMRAAYLFLRTVENRIQMLNDAQQHDLPTDAVNLQRLAIGLQFESVAAFESALDAERAVIAQHFAGLLKSRERRPDAAGADAYWRALPEGGNAEVLADMGFQDAEAADEVLRRFANAAGVKSASSQSAARLARVMPALISATARASDPDVALPRMIALISNVLRRSSYLALLDEQPAALQRLVEILGRSALLGERLAHFPLLLDELLDARTTEPLPDSDALLVLCRERVAPHLDDIERAIAELNELRQILSFRVALATLDHRMPATEASRYLAWIADGVIAATLDIAQQDMQRAHGGVPEGAFAVVGYGSVGGEELAFGSDLDLVFLYEANAEAQSTGARSLDAARWYARLAQKIVNLLQTPTGAGRLYDVDVRLRPDGAKGLLVSTLQSFAEYQEHRAWTWEHQALVRARAVAGDSALCNAFEAIRRNTLSKQRDAAAVQAEVLAMRARMRAELDRSSATQFDLKQGEGGLVDIEFILQAQVLIHACTLPAVLEVTQTTGLIDALGMDGLLGGKAAGLKAAHAELSARALQCMLDRRKRVMVPDAPLEAARSAVSDVCQQVLGRSPPSAV